VFERIHESRLCFALFVWFARAALLAMLQPLRWHCVECAVHHERDVREEQHRSISAANKQ